MLLLTACIVMAAALVPRVEASVDMSCDCRMWHHMDTSLTLHCTRKHAGTYGISCQKASVPDIPRGYQFVSGYGLVKLYRTCKTWWAAKEACEADGFRLAIPPDRNAFDGLKQLFVIEKHLSWAFIGVSDEANEGEFIGIDGHPAPFLPWQLHQPSDSIGQENCVEATWDGRTNDVNCLWAQPFLCDRVLSVGIPDSYRWLEDAARFYKIHTEKRDHANAAKACRSENATLAVTDTWRRGEDLLLTLVKLTSDQYHIGFTDEAVEGDFVTETGRHLKDMEFQVWGHKEPNNNDNGRDEDCLTLSGEGYYNDVRCDLPLAFICEIIPV